MKNLITKILFIFLFTFLSNQLLAQSITLVSDPATINQTLCVNSAITEIKYDLSGGLTEVTVTGLPTGVDGTYYAGVYTINGTPTESGNFYYTISASIPQTGPQTVLVTSEGTLNIDSPASASQGLESNLCLNNTASLGDLAVSEGTYLWTHNGTGTLENNTTLSPVYTPAQGDVGNAVVLTLTVTSNNTCPISTATSTFTYNVKGIPSFSGNLYTYVGATSQLNGSPGMHQYYPWMSSDASIATIDNNGLVTGVALGSTTIMYYDTNYCSVSQTFDVVTLIIPSISGNLTICSGSTSQLTGTETPMANNPWVSSNTSVATVSSSGLVSGISAGTITITYKNSTGGTSTVNFVVNETPSVSVNSQTICNGGSTTLYSYPSTLGGTYLWGGNETSANITVSPTSTSNFTLIYTLNGCSSNQGLGVVTVNPIPPVSAGTDITVCSGASITLNGTGAQTYSWSNGVTNGTSFVPTLGTTSYTLTGISNGCTATDVVVVTVNVSPNLVINNPSPVCSPSAVDITNPAVTAGSSNGSLMTYWTDANCTTNLGSPWSIINPGPIFIKSTLGSCFNIKPVNVIINSQPSISGILSTYVTSTTQLTGSSTAAVNTPWLSSNSLIATVSSSGLVTGLAAGNVVITYTNTNGCSNTVNVTVGLLNSISLTSTIGSDNQTICANSSINTVTYATTGATGAVFSGLPAGINGDWNSNIVTLSGTTSISGIHNYIITLTGGNGNITINGTFNVNSNTTIISQSTANQIQCLTTGTFSSLGVNAVGSGLTYQWFSNTEASNSGGILEAGATYSFYTPSSTTAGTLFYYCVVTGTCSTATTTVSGAIITSATPTITVNSPSICNGSSAMLEATPSQAGGTYLWSDSSTGATLNVTPLVTTTYSVVYTLNGCSSTSVSVSVTVNPSPILTITSPTAVCSPSTVDLTSSSVTFGSTGSGALTYWTDANCTSILYSPTTVSTPGTYFIKSTLGSCFDVKPVTVAINTTPVLSITSPTAVCSPSTVDITASSVTLGSTGSGALTYWTDANCTSSLGSPTTVSTSETYFIKSTLGSCFDVKPVTVAINTTPVLSITSPTAVCSPSTVDITASSVTLGSTGSGVLTYWTDANCTSSLGSPTTVSTSETYFIKSTLGSCFDVKPVTVAINTTPVLYITSPTAVCSPSTVDLTSSSVTLGSTGSGVLTYWMDANCTSSLGSPTTVSTSETYFIKSTLGSCFDVKPVTVAINTTPVLSITSPTAVCSPNTVDLTSSSVTLGSTGSGALTYWMDANCTSSLGSPTTVSTSETYFIKSTLGSCFDVKSVTVAINTTPILTITSPTAVCSPNTLDITASSVTLGSTGSGVLTYWTDVNCTSSLGSPTTVSTSETYFIKSTLGSCFDVKPVTVAINATPILTITSPTAVCSPNTVDITSSSVTLGSTGSGVLTYWTDANCTSSLGSPTTVSTSETYFIKSTLGSCFDVKPVTVAINTTPILTITSPTAVCSPSTVDLTSSSVTLGSTGSGVLTYWTDANCTSSLGSPTTVSTSETYFIKSTLGSCIDVKPVTVAINATPILTITSPTAVCSPNTVDLTSSSVTLGSTGSGVLTYWMDANCTSSLGSPTTVSTSETYFIKSTLGSCFDVKPVTVAINTTPILTITSPTAVCSPNTVDITSSSVTLGSTGSGALTYWMDANCTSSLGSPTTVSTSETYFIKSTLGSCFDVKPVTVAINTTPILSITNPATVDAPLTIDITLPSITNGSISLGVLTYWINPDASIPLTNPTAISMSGTYYIKSVLGNCSDTNFVTVTINKVSSPTTQLSAFVVPKGISQNGLCDGSAEVIVTSGSAPYTYLFSDNSTNSIAVSLCDGLKSVRIADANNDTLYVNFIISSPENLTTTTTLKDSIVIDSVYNSVLTNCIIDYSLIDSVKIVNYTILQNDSIKIDWNIYTGQAYVTVTNVYSMNIISTAGVYSFALQVYCPNKAMGMFLTAYDQLYITTIDISITGIKDVELNEYFIFPNPFTEKLFITSNSKKTYEVILTDLTGKVLMKKEMTENNSIIDTHDLISGNYLLIIKSNENVKTFKVCK